MPALLPILTLILTLAALAGVIVLLLRRQPPPDLAPLDTRFDALIAEQRRIEQSLRDELARQRTELATQLDRATQTQLQHHDATRAEITATLAQLRAAIEQHLEKTRADTLAKLDEHTPAPPQPTARPAKPPTTTRRTLRVGTRKPRKSPACRPFWQHS